MNALERQIAHDLLSIDKSSIHQIAIRELFHLLHITKCDRKLKSFQ